MSLPSSFHSNYEYFKEAIHFLHTYSWIYQYANTRCITSGVLNNIPQEFVHYFMQCDNESFNSFPLIYNKLDEMIALPESLKDFCSHLRKLTANELNEPAIERELPIRIGGMRKIDEKKQYEILQLSALITEICNDCDCIIDFGSGLGYVDELLYNINNKFLILGLESDKYRVKEARKRILSNIPHAEKSIRYEQEMITENSKANLEKYIEELCAANDINRMDNIAIIGLHACADLTVISMKLFLTMNCIRKLVILPCCYHKLQLAEECEERIFKNFPLSKALNDVIDGGPKEYAALLNRPFMRLACQQTLARWLVLTERQHEEHGVQMFQRALAEAILNKGEYIKRKKNEPKHEKETSKDFLTYAKLTETYSVHGSNDNDNNVAIEWHEQHEKNFYDIMKRYPNGPKLVESLTCLQTSIQKLCENLVLYDRLCYMQEHSQTHNLQLTVRYEKIFNEALSPRCTALIAQKL